MSRMERRELLVLLDSLSTLSFGAPPNEVKIASLSVWCMSKHIEAA